MTDQTPDPRTIPADKVQAVADWLLNEEMANGGLDEMIAPQLAARAQMCWEARAKLLALLRPTLADMTNEERRECRRMQADVKGMKGRRVIAYPGDGGEMTQIMLPNGLVVDIDPENVTPRPDLPRWEWPGDQKAEDVPPVKVGTVIESADDPRVADLPVGTVLRDIDGEEVTKTGGGIDHWSGPGYVPIAGDGTEYGPWTVARLPRKPATAPAHALPDGWRLADHDVYGRVIVTTQTPSDAGNVYFVFSDPSDQKGHYWHLCAPDRLTYLDADEEDDQ